MIKWKGSRSNKTGGESMAEIPKPNQIYRHFKGNLYKIVTLATHSETGEQMVVYQALYGECTVYVRELSMFMSKVDRKKYPKAEQEQRFALVPQIIGQETAAEQNRSVSPQPVKSEPQGEPEKPNMQAGEAETGTSQRQQTQPEPEQEQSAPLQTEKQPVKSEARSEPEKSDVRANETKKETSQGYQTQSEEETVSLDPFLLQFLDADTYREKLNLLAALHGRITDDMINTMAVSLDLEVNDGDIEDRYEALKTCLLTMEKYECNRLR